MGVAAVVVAAEEDRSEEAPIFLERATVIRVARDIVAGPITPRASTVAGPTGPVRVIPGQPPAVCGICRRTDSVIRLTMVADGNMAGIGPAHMPETGPRILRPMDPVGSRETRPLLIIRLDGPAMVPT